MIQWHRHPRGSWLPVDRNDFHSCDLFITVVDGIRVAAHKTADGKRWIARASVYPRGPGVPYAGMFPTRKAALSDALMRQGRLTRR